jgi:two-component system chemotaxis sensor kinase CheA
MLPRPQVPSSPSDNHLVDDLTREFLLESQEGLDRMERCLTDLETRPGDAELLADIFRSVHTIKGTTGFLGFSRLEALSHAGENLLGLLRDGKLAANAAIISGLLALMDMLRGVLRSIETTGAEGESQQEDAAMIARLETLQREEPAVALPETVLAAAVAAPAPPGKPRKPRAARRPRATQRCSPPPALPGEAGPPSEFKTAPPPRQPESETHSAPATTAVASPPARPATETPSAPETPAISTSGTADSTLRVDVELLNRMMNLVGELVLTRNQILQATSTNAGFAVLGRRLDMVTADLRESVMKARMQPVSHVFSRFPRLVRDLALALDSACASKWKARKRSWTRASSKPSAIPSPIPSATPSIMASRCPTSVSPAASPLRAWCACAHATKAATSSSRSTTTAPA